MIPGNVPWAAASLALAQVLDSAHCSEVAVVRRSAVLPEQPSVPAQDTSRHRNNGAIHIRPGHQGMLFGPARSIFRSCTTCADASVVHVWTAPGAQGVMCDLAHGTSAVMCPAFDAAA